jgi:pilus assembly protein Flp/PilA
MDPYLYVISRLRSWCARSDRGASLVEYALLVALIAMVCFIAVEFVGTEANSEYQGVGSSIRG